VHPRGDSLRAGDGSGWRRRQALVDNAARRSVLVHPLQSRLPV